jgi:hypothetical protein
MIVTSDGKLTMNQPLSGLGTGIPSCCVRINWNGQSHTVCSPNFCGGGGTQAIQPRSKTLSGLGLDLLNTSELANMTIAQLQAYANQLRASVASMQSQLASGICTFGPCTPGAIEGLQAAIIEFQAELAAVVDAINGTISPSQIDAQHNNYMDAFNSGQNFTTGSIGSDLFSFLQKDVAGIPVWVIGAGIAALMYFKK